MSKLRHAISSQQFLGEDLLDELLFSAKRLEQDDAAGNLPQAMRGRILATLFYEPSTRTRFSFEAAMQKLGGSVLTAENAKESSSATKGETLADTVRVVSGYADAIVIRHYLQGAVQVAADASPVPVINAGDGIGEHPTQALADIFTIHKELGHLDQLKVTIVGDLLNGRTIHSLLPLLGMNVGMEITLVSPPQLRLPDSYKNHLNQQGVRYSETHELTDAIAGADVVYVTRVQRERFGSDAEYAQVKDGYVIDTKLADSLKRNAIIMHALPRLKEISPEVDANYRAAYFRQAKNALYMRMALLEYLLSERNV